MGKAGGTSHSITAFSSRFSTGLVQLGHSDPDGLLGHLLCRGLSQCPIIVFTVSLVGFEPRLATGMDIFLYFFCVFS